MPSDIKTTIANEAIRIVTGARRAAYGKPEQNFERIARLWNAHLVNVGILDTVGFAKEMGPGDVAAFMRLMKEARLAETPDHLDSYVDLVGYALCGAEVAGVDGAAIEAKADQTRADLVCKAEQPAKLQIEAGKYYRDGNGCVVGPMHFRDDEPGNAYPWLADSRNGARKERGRLFTNEGESYSRNAGLNLTEEIPAP